MEALLAPDDIDDVEDVKNPNLTIDGMLVVFMGRAHIPRVSNVSLHTQQSARTVCEYVVTFILVQFSP